MSMNAPSLKLEESFSDGIGRVKAGNSARVVEKTTNTLELRAVFRQLSLLTGITGK